MSRSKSITKKISSTTHQDQLFLACKDGNKEKIEHLLNRKGTNVNAEDDERNTCLIHTAFNGWFQAAKILIKKGAIVDTQNDKGETALHIATEKCHKKYGSNGTKRKVSGYNWNHNQGFL